MITGHKTTDEWLAKQPIWHDRDVIKFVAVAAIVGGLLGFVFGWSYGQPDLSGMTVNYVRG